MNSGVDDKAKQEEVTNDGLEGGEDTTSNIKGDSYVEIDYRYKVVIDENAANDKRCTLINVNDPEDKKFITEGFSLKWEKLCSALGFQIQESDGKALCSEGCFILGANGRYQPLCEYFRNNGNKKSLKSIDKIFITEAAWADENQKSCCRTAPPPPPPPTGPENDNEEEVIEEVKEEIEEVIEEVKEEVEEVMEEVEEEIEEVMEEVKEEVEEVMEEVERRSKR